jgi:hypothetical protein
MDSYFVLDDRGEPLPESDADAWSRWFATADRSVARTVVSAEVTVLTTFNGIDEAAGEGAPKLFETHVFGGVLDGEELRRCTRAEAVAAHGSLVAWCRAGGNAPDFGISDHDIT